MQCDNNDARSLAMAYVPWQNWEALFDEGTALLNGTIFPALFKPFQGVC